MIKNKYQKVKYKVENNFYYQKVKYKIKNNFYKAVAVLEFMGAPVFMNSCTDDNQETQIKHHTEINYIPLDLNNLEAFKDAARREIVNKNNNGRVLYKLTPASKEAATNKITTSQWNGEIKHALQEMEKLAANQIHDVVFLNQDTVFMPVYDIEPKDVQNYKDSVGVINGTDLQFLKHCGFKVVALTR